MVTAIITFFCVLAYGVLLWQFYTAFKNGCATTSDAAHGNSLAVLNRRHAVSMFAMMLAIGSALIVNVKRLPLQLPTAAACWATAALCLFAGIVGAMSVQYNPTAIVPGRAWYLILRALYLASYELFFRGVLFTVCLLFAPLAVAAGINLGLYAGAHVFSPQRELLGTLPFGLLLIALTYYTGSVWPATALHLAVGLSYDSSLLFSKPKPILT